MLNVYLGIDVGSTTTKLVALGSDGTIHASYYRRAHGRPRHVLLELSHQLERDLPPFAILGVGLTGSGGARMSRIIGGIHANELVTQARSVAEYHPDTRTIIEIGGQDSKLLSLQWDENSRQMVLEDFAMNSLCAAGTGSFLDQQAERLGIDIEGEFEEIALSSTNPARIAGRCTVFAKSDMIHLQQEGTPVSDVLAGLCLALARNFKTVIGKGHSFAPPILFQGGVASNKAVAKAFEDVLGREPGSLRVPENHLYMAALGAAWTIRDELEEGREHPFRGFDQIEEAIRARKPMEAMPPLRRKDRKVSLPRPSLNGATSIPVYLGIDVGSISTCLALVDQEDRPLADRYLMTAGEPLEAVRNGLADIAQDLDPRMYVAGAGVTGSGRYLTGHFIGADVVRNEITAQARAAVAIHPEVDTILEIGGQDSKYIRIQNGAVVDFAMNNACAAGTGSFLEEQSERLNLDIKLQFADTAFEAPAPSCLGERCTVFMESDVVHHQQNGATVGDLTAGLAYSVAQNYLNRMVNGREVGKEVVFQGGVASNESVGAAFEHLLDRPIRIPEHNLVTGAIGAAILAREGMADGETSRFRGFDLSDVTYVSKAFVCNACSNVCEVKRVDIDGVPPVFYGARCDKFEEAGKKKKLEHDIPDLFAEREALLLGGWSDPGPRKAGRVRVGIPRALIVHDMFPYWHAFFRKLDMDIVLSSSTSSKTVQDTNDHAAAETCFPVQLMYGHTLELLERDVDFMMLAAVLDREKVSPGQENNKYCPFIPASGQMVRAHLKLEEQGVIPLNTPLHLSQPQALKRQMGRMAEQLGIPVSKALDAAKAGSRAQSAFYESVRKRGQEILQDSNLPVVVLVGRPYNTCDLGVCQDLPRQLRKLGVLPMPMDFLPVRSTDITSRHIDMYWRSGQDILAAGQLIRDNDRLHAIYLTSFDCGPDSFLVSYFRRMMDGKPFLELEVDAHTAAAGMMTRCEAFLDSLNLGR